MQSIKDIEGFNSNQPRTLETFICDGCGEEVQKIQTIVFAGPRKGETIIGNIGCKCEDIKLAQQAKETRERLRIEKMMTHFNSHSLLNKSLQKATLANYQPTSKELAYAKQKAIEYINNFDGEGNILFTGSYGTGKSHLSVGITKELMKKGYTAVFISVPKLLTKIKNTYNNDGPTEHELLEVMAKVDLLVIDDIGAEQKTEWSTPKLFEIFDERAGKATIFTTNLSSAQLKAWVGERNFSRMLENTTSIKMNGKDYRRKHLLGG